jgi:hypothetical protein
MLIAKYLISEYSLGVSSRDNTFKTFRDTQE